MPTVQCLSCGRELSCRDDQIGRRFKCPSCRADGRATPTLVPAVLPEPSPRRAHGFPKLRLDVGLAIAAVGVLLTVCFFAVVAGLLVKQEGETTKEATIGEEMRFGDLRVVVTARMDDVWASSPGGRDIVSKKPLFTVRITFANDDAKRIINAGAQVDVATLTDDVGNSYGRITTLSDEFGHECDIINQVPPGKVRLVRSDERATDILVFDRPLAGASTLTLTLSASRYGGTGKIKVLIPKSAWAATK
jgi:hypothetical protein